MFWAYKLHQKKNNMRESAQKWNQEKDRLLSENSEEEKGASFCKAEDQVAS